MSDDVMPWDVVIPDWLISDLPVHRFESRSGKSDGHIVREHVDRFGGWYVTCTCPAGTYRASVGGCYRMIEVRAARAAARGRSAS